MRADDLRGRWRVVRAIRHADGTRARFEGEAVWAPDGDWFRCTETGRLTQAGTTLQGSRETLWRDAPGGIEVAFADGRPFHLWRPGREATHDCPPDDYRLRYDLTAWPRWSVRWRVTGPRKDYRALTRYSRL